MLAPKSLTRPTFEHHYLRFIQDAFLLLVKLEFEHFNYISPQNPTSDFLFWSLPYRADLHRKDLIVRLIFSLIAWNLLCECSLMGFLRWFIISKTCAYNPKPFPLNPLPSGSDTFYEDCLHSVFHISGLLRKPRASLEAQTVKNLPAMQVLPPGWRSPGEGHGNPLQYSCLENSMDRGAWWTMVHGVAKIGTQLRD